jgi:hypothetical protein
MVTAVRTSNFISELLYTKKGSLEEMTKLPGRQKETQLPPLSKN